MFAHSGNRRQLPSMHPACLRRDEAVQEQRSIPHATEVIRCFSTFSFFERARCDNESRGNGGGGEEPGVHKIWAARLMKSTCHVSAVHHTDSYCFIMEE